MVVTFLVYFTSSFAVSLRIGRRMISPQLDYDYELRLVYQQGPNLFVLLQLYFIGFYVVRGLSFHLTRLDS